MKSFFRQLANRVQSGSARTGLDDDATDYYPVPLERTALRPGVIYADPYGHVMVVVKWVDQTADKGGLLLAVDGQPDTSIGRKRFWEGTFLFANDVKSAGPGFKAFRPLARGADGKLEPVANAAIGRKGDAAHAPFSDDQKKVSADGFYARMAKLINPAGLDAEKAYKETLDALVEQLTVRVGSVDNGEKYWKEKGAGQQAIAMPDGPKIFETTGPWEDYATPSRDMRLLIAMNVLLALPERIVKHPELYNMGGKKPESVRDRDREAARDPGRHARHHLHAQRRLAAEADRRRSARAARGAGDRLQPERLRRGALGRARGIARGVDLQAPPPARAEGEDGRVPRLVPRRPPPDALTRARSAEGRSFF